MTNEQAKREAIKKAYGKYPFAQRAISLMYENGYIEHYYTDNEMNLYSDLFEVNGYGRFRLKELSSIENNNGWIRIEPDGSNLPTETGYYDFRDFNSERNGKPLNPVYWHKNATKIGWFIEVYTHYKPITPELKPIY